MKKILQFIAISLAFGTVNAQTQNFGVPLSFNKKVSLTKAGYQLPSINNLESQSFYENQSKLNGQKLMQYGVPHDVQIDVFKKAQKQVLLNGKNLYQFYIESPSAISLNVVFSKFHLAEGTLLYIFNHDKTKYIGAYTSLNNNSQNMLGTELLYTNKLFIEIQEPAANENKSQLEINRIVHGFTNLDDLIEKQLNDAGDCNIDVNCPQGSGWEIPRNGVAMLVNSNGGFCSGSMVNNTAGTNTPYFLTANHCGSSPGSWIFRFRWESPAASADCGTSAPSVNGPENMNINGGVTRANYAQSDFHLIELNSLPQQAWDVTYNGWDKSGNTPQSGAGIHHPSGDIKKIAISSTPYQVGSFGGSPQNHWQAFWSEGVTEGGSSGSPLFDQYRRIVGQLHGGGSYCGSSDLSDFYGQFSASWIGGGTASTRLSNWLDPQNTGEEFIDANVSNTLDPFFTSNVIGAKGTFCSGAYTPKVVLTNGGSTVMTTAKLTYVIDGVSQDLTWNGNLGLFESDTVVFPTQNFTSGSHTISITVNNPNDTIDQNMNNNFVTSSFHVVIGGDILTLEMNLDCFANETSWAILDNNANEMFIGGPYEALDSGYTVTHNVCLNPGCYDLVIYDSYGDGMFAPNFCSDTGSVILHNSQNDILTYLPTTEADFTFNTTKNFCIGSNNLIENNSSNLSVYPNPFSSKIYLKNDQNIEKVKLIDVTGKLIYSVEELNSKTFEFDLNVENGIYYLIIKSGSNEFTKKIIK